MEGGRGGVVVVVGGGALVTRAELFFPLLFKISGLVVPS